MNKHFGVALAIVPLLTLLFAGGMPTHARELNGRSYDENGMNSPHVIVEGWAQVNTSGFGSVGNTMISALDVFNGQMYATTWNEAGAQVWRTSNGKAWSQFTPGAPFTTTVIYDARDFGSYLYIGTLWETGGGEIWRTDGTTWERVATGGLGDANNVAFAAFGVLSNNLYVATANLVTGVEIWRSSTGDAGSWTQVNADGFGSGATWDGITFSGAFNGYLYVGLGRKVGADGSIAELWRSDNGTNWTPVFTDGLGDPNNSYVTAFASTTPGLLIGLRNLTTGGQLWRSTNGTTFSPVVTNGHNNPKNARPYGLLIHANDLYIVYSNWVTGAEVWKSHTPPAEDERIVEGGWGDPNNKNADYFDKAAVSFNGSLYIGTGNDVTGGQIWQMLHSVYLPLVVR